MSLMRTVLVVDDNPAVSTALGMLFGLHDIKTLTAASPQAGLASLAVHRVDLVIADMNFSADTTSGQEGLALFRDIRARYPDMPVDPADGLDAPGVGRAAGEGGCRRLCREALGQ